MYIKEKKMDIVKLVRMFDSEAINDGYHNFPDDLISIILDYTGNLLVKPKNIYEIIFKYTYHRYVEDYRLVEGKTRYARVYYCDDCRKFFKNCPKNHDKGKMHKKNHKPLLSNKQVYRDLWIWYQKKGNKLDHLHYSPRNHQIYDIGLFG